VEAGLGPGADVFMDMGGCCAVGGYGVGELETKEKNKNRKSK